MKSGSVINRVLKHKVYCFLFTCLLLGFAETLPAAVITWEGSASADWTNPDSWVGGVRPTNSISVDTVRFADNSERVIKQPIMNYRWDVNAIQFDGAGWTIRRRLTHILGIGNGGVALHPASAGTATISPAIYLSGSQAWDVSAGSTLNVDGGVGGASSTLTKTGEGRLIIAENTTNTYGNTIVSSGTLLINGSMDVRRATVSISVDAVLGGTGTISRKTTIANGGIVAAGNNGAGTLNISSLTLGSTSVLEFELDSLGGSNDLIVTGDLVLDGLLNVTNLGGLQAGTYTLFTCSGRLTDNGLQLNNMPAGFVGSISTDAAGGVYLQVSAGGSSQASIVVCG